MAAGTCGTAGHPYRTAPRRDRDQCHLAEQRHRRLRGFKAILQTLTRRIHEPIPVIGRWLRRVVQGYFNYHAVSGNVDRLGSFRT